MNNIQPHWPLHITVAAVIRHDEQFLMVEELSEGRIVYNQPAGHVEPNETLLTAIQRETLEETGWHFMPSSIIGIYFYTHPETRVTYQRICFSGQLGQYESSQPLDTGIIQALWLSRADLAHRLDKLRTPMVLQCIDDYLANKQYPLSLITDLRSL